MKIQMTVFSCICCSLFCLGVHAAERDSVRINDLSDFDAVSVCSGIETIVSPEVNGVVAVATSEVMPLLAIKSDEGLLTIGFDQKVKGNWKFRVKDKVTVYVPQKSYRFLKTQSGAVLRLPETYQTGNIRIAASSGSIVRGGMNCPVLTLETRSGSVVRLQGACDSLAVDASSGSVVRCDALQGKSVMCRASSGCVLKLNASKRIDISAASGSVVTYGGEGEARIDRRSGAIVKRKK